MTILEVGDIDWIEAAGSSVRVHSGGSVWPVHQRLGELERSLAPDFARVHRCAIIAVDRLFEVLVDRHGDYVAVLRNGERVRVGRSYKRQLRAMLQGRR